MRRGYPVFSINFALIKIIAGILSGLQHMLSIY